MPCVIDFKRDRRRWRYFQIVIKHRAVGGILSCGNLRRQGSFLIVVPANAEVAGCSRNAFEPGDLGAGLPQWREIVQRPKSASVGGDHKIIIVHGQIAYVRGGQIQFQRLPMIAVVEGNVHGILRAGNKPFSLRITSRTTQAIPGWAQVLP